MSVEKRNPSFLDRIQDELVDSVDEELELEIDDDRLASLLDHVTDSPEQETIDRSFYFRELLQLQRELVKLQDWILQRKLKVVVLFEGRDAAGKGGRDQACHPASQSTHLSNGGPVGTDRTGAQPVVLPALRGAPAGRRRDRVV